MYEEVNWISKYDIGIDGIDKQHKELFELSNSFFKLKEDDSVAEFKKYVYEFNKYMAEHFKDEELYMQSMGYPELKAHEKLHQNLIDSITKILKESGTIPVMKSKMKEIAKRFIDHILKEDIKIKYYKNDHQNVQDIEYITDESFK
jgi:hemerythrin